MGFLFYKLFKNKTMKNLEFAEKFTKLVIAKMSEIESDWEVPWLFERRRNFIPVNITGRKYKGGNTLMLLLHLMFSQKYITPVFMTFKQAKERGLNVLSGSNSFPVYYYLFRVVNNETKDVIDYKDYVEFDDSEKDKYNVFVVPKHYNVFNIQDTNFEQVYPEKWAELIKKYRTEVNYSNEDELYSNEIIDSLLRDKSWVCEIKIQKSDEAYYLPSKDYIVNPLKMQFKKGEAFYSTLLHEMAHSTGHESRLNRKGGKIFGDFEYGREELVAELTSALVCFYLGIGSSIREENLSYLKGWIEDIKQKPDFLMTILAEVSKASEFVINNLGMDYLYENEDFDIEVIKEAA